MLAACKDPTRGMVEPTVYFVVCLSACVILASRSYRFLGLSIRWPSDIARSLEPEIYIAGGDYSLVRFFPISKQSKDLPSNMSASSFLAVMVDDEVLVKAAESDLEKVEGST
jgi:hypothetical protein